MERAHVFYSGDVQGVGFRYTTVWLARNCEVTGFVRNLSDGRVELVVEGARDEVEALVAGVRERMSGCIREENCTWEECTGAFSRFSIAF